MSIQRYPKYIKFIIYLIAAILVNIAGETLFFRLDLTKNQVYSLSEPSKEAVSTLNEPLSIKVFFTKKLPAPHNSTELYLRDLLKEYSLNSNKYFNFRFYDVSPEAEGIGDEGKTNREIARDYGIHPVQIQLIENDEVKFKQAYMGLAMIHGDLVERIPAITSTDGLEYRLTTAIQKLNNKVSALLKLQEPVKVQLILSSSMYKLAPVIGIKELEKYPDKIKKIVKDLNAKLYNKLAFTHLDPDTDETAAKVAAEHEQFALKWPAIAQAKLKAGKGALGIIIRYKDQVREIPLLSVVRIPIFGTQYQLAEIGQVEEELNANMERLVRINEDIGFLSDFGTLEYRGLGPMAPQGQETIGRFNSIVSQTYSIKPVSLKKGSVAKGLKCLVVARPTEKFSDYDLYQIDQALMNGTNLAIFLDAFKEKAPPQQQAFMAQQMPSFAPMDTGLEKLLEHYGVRIKKSLALDENCYRQRLGRNRGGGEQPIYFAPIIQSENINKDLDFIQAIKGLVTVKASPLELDKKRIEEQGLEAHKLFSTSSRSWEMRQPINLNPMFINPPASDSDMSSLPLAYFIEGSFHSYFKGKPTPEKPAEKKKTDKDKKSDSSKDQADDKEAEKQESQIDLSQIERKEAFKEKSPKSKIFIMATAEMLKDNLLDEQGRSTNAMFMMNMIDALNDREGLAVMRSKGQPYNPLKQTGPVTRKAIKFGNIAGLPVVVIMFGMVVWVRRTARKRKIQALFMNNSGQARS
ncbi:MAG: ABC transporter permease [Desulfobacteraceae bacterium]|nr:ABC transporter permease [Desulfobacteraceae bacterium]